MHLKSLRLQGFKTFARRTELTFSSGITAIVGPNGSGKSNLVDAIRWALGERNARGLRGQRMEDVIYAGGPGKSAVGMAEVSLLLDNADQRLNVEFNELEVSRRLFRSGESEYLINGSRARLKDIDALLASTGLRQDGYAVTAQNDIDFVIQAVPGTRRELIEEAAGVRRLRDQRQEAVNRLLEADRDMRRARDILNELAPRAEELRVQAEAALEYQRVADAVKALQGSLARDAWRKAMVQLRRARSRVQAAEQKLTAAAEALRQFEPVYAEHRQALLEARDARWRQQESLASTRLQLADAQHQARIAQERNLAAIQALDALQRELRRLSESEEAGGRVVKELGRAVAAAAAELANAEAELADALAAEDAGNEAHGALNRQRAQLQVQAQTLQREALAASAELRQLDGRVQFLSDQQGQFRRELESWTNRRQATLDELERRQAAATRADDQLRDVGSRAAAVDEGLGTTEQTLDAARKRVTAHEARLRSLEAELGALRTLLDGALRRNPVEGDERWERLLEVIEVDPVHRSAVESALEGWLHGWVARDQSSFEQAARRLQQADDARETLLWSDDTVTVDGVPDGLLAAASLVKAPPELAAVIERLLDRVVVVADREQATQVVRDHPELRAVTSSGELITAVSYRGGKAADPVLAVQARIRDAEDALAAERRFSLAAAEDVERLVSDRFRMLKERQQLLEQMNLARTEGGQAAGALAAVSEALRREDERGLQLKQQLERLTVLLDQAEGLRTATIARQSSLAEQEQTVARDTDTVEHEASEQSAGLATTIAARQQAELRAALARQRAEDLQRQLEQAETLVRSQGDELMQRRAAEEELAVQPALINEERRQWLERATVLQTELEALEALPLPDDDGIAVLEAQVRDDEQRNVTLQVQLAHADDAQASARMETEAAQVEVDRCAGVLRQEGQAVEEDTDSVEEVDWQKTEREVSRLQRRLEAMGAVNLLAPDEYAQAHDRCDSLARQLTDLEQAAQQLTELRQRLEDEIDGRFRTVFQAVAVNFQEFFSELFVGGRATLRLESQAEGDRNPLDDGVEILAQTPGKRLQPLTLLSGGERALTALAFLFALQAVNPSPFYVLDEVDAALDDANVVRFNRVLTRLAEQQQFLVVTHNHSTMAQAEALYGVTLGEHGISRIVSVRLQKDTLVPVAERSA